MLLRKIFRLVVRNEVRVFLVLIRMRVFLQRCRDFLHMIYE